MDTFQSPAPSSRRDRDDPGPASVTIPASPFMRKLGFGTGVSVYLMERSPRGHSRSPWAVKKINSGCSRSQRSLFQRRLRDEARILRSLRHPNIVGYRALAAAPDGSLCLAMEFGGERSLQDRIEERRERGLGAFPAPTVLRVALCVARGLQYLHTEQRLLHGDIKSPNVVVRGAFETVKICDVGVSLRLDENLTVSDPCARYVGSEPWLPPEALEPGGIVSDRSDVFALGLTLWEMLALAVPHLPPPPEGRDSRLEEDFRLEDSRLADSVSKDSRLEDSQGEDSQLVDSHLEDSHLDDSTLDDSHLEDSQGEDSHLEDSQLEDSQLEDSQGDDSQIENSHLADSMSSSDDSWDEAAFRAALGSRPALPRAVLVPAQAPVLELFCACTAAAPRQRPPAAAIVRALESIPGTAFPGKTSPESRREHPDPAAAIVRALESRREHPGDGIPGKNSPESRREHPDPGKNQPGEPLGASR
ncbi:lymphokine-activated killer T-cell-originated protein kinase [Taeniopygia guttata]|uniref:lymphokine-activated killer T-cell-originated protein kinase n=1 Tax=Taeniopygia guttata TaxID=59729 RepID=UPI003BB8AA24